MRIAVFDDNRPCVVKGESIYDLTPLLPGWTPSPWFINDFIERLPGLAPAIRELVNSAEPLPLDLSRLRAPVPRPGQILAAPLNFAAHREEMSGPLTAGPGTARELGFFLKSPGSVSSPSHPVVLPDLPGRRIDFEAEVAAVVGKRTRQVSVAQALDHVLGYTIVLDMTLRMTEVDREERTMRKSYSTFTPMGPWVVTADEIPDPAHISIKAWKNGELRQEASLGDLIVPVDELISRASQVVELQPGDVYATGSPAGVGQVEAGDRIRVEVPMIGDLEIAVVAPAL